MAGGLTSRALARLLREQNKELLTEFSRAVELPEHKLLIAIIFRAMMDFTGSLAGLALDHSSRFDLVAFKSIKAAHDFLFDDLKDPFSFMWICEQLRPDDPEILAEAVRRFVKRKDAYECMALHLKNGIQKNRKSSMLKKLFMR